MNQLTTLQNNNLQTSDCDLGGIIIKETQYQDTHSELSDLEVSRFRLLTIVYLYKLFNYFSIRLDSLFFYLINKNFEQTYFLFMSSFCYI